MSVLCIYFLDIVCTLAIDTVDYLIYIKHVECRMHIHIQNIYNPQAKRKLSICH